MSSFKRLLFLSLLLFGSTVTFASSAHAKDSVKRAVWVITPRINSTGHFPFTGSLLNYHLNADINIFFEKKALGFFLFKSQDLVTNSFVNYLQPGVFATAKLSSSLRARVFFGYLFSQAESFRDADSDYYTALSLYWNITEGVRLENTSLFYDLEQGVKLADRLLISWQQKKFKLDLYVWHRVVLEEDNHATSAMLAFTFPQIRLSKSSTLLFTSSYQRYLTANKPSFALRDGFLFSLAMPIEVR